MYIILGLISIIIFLFLVKLVKKLLRLFFLGFLTIVFILWLIGSFSLIINNKEAYGIILLVIGGLIISLLVKKEKK